MVNPTHLDLTPLDWTIGGTALVGNVLLGLWLALRARRSATSDEFFLAGRRLTWPIVGASLLATNIGAEHMVGLCGDAYRYGFCAGANELTTAIQPRHRGRDPDPLLPQEPGVHDSRVPRTPLPQGSPAVLLGHDAGDLRRDQDGVLPLRGGAGDESLLGWEIMPTIAALALVTALITILGGFAAVAYTDAIHAPIMIAGSAVVLAIGFVKVGGWDALCTAVGAHARPRRHAHAQAVRRPGLSVLGHHSLRDLSAARSTGASTRSTSSAMLGGRRTWTTPAGGRCSPSC